MLWFWYVLVAEILLGGNGHFIEFFGIALRTWIVGIFLLVFFFDAFRKKHFSLFRLPRPLTLPLIGIGSAVILAMITGFVNGHDSRAIIQDSIPFAFLLLLFPAREFVTKDRFPFYQKLTRAYLLLAAIFSLVSLFLFSSGITMLQDPYYKWFRDTAGGKITDVGNHFFRIVLPEHILLVPIMLFLVASIMKKRSVHILSDRIQWVHFAIAVIPFALNLSRTYFLAFFIGLFFLFSRERWKIWLIVSAGSILLALSIFSVLHLAASRGQSFGFELLTGRFSSIASPDTERSAATRKTLLPPIWKEIKKHPMIGSGLGATISFTDPISKENITTRHFDWGYLEIWTELGLLGLLSYLSLIIYLFFHTTGSTRASVAALAFMNVTTPALFHVFGVVILVYLLATHVSNARSALPPHIAAPDPE